MTILYSIVLKFDAYSALIVLKVATDVILLIFSHLGAYAGGVAAPTAYPHHGAYTAANGAANPAAAAVVSGAAGAYHGAASHGALQSAAAAQGQHLQPQVNSHSRCFFFTGIISFSFSFSLTSRDLQFLWRNECVNEVIMKIKSDLHEGKERNWYLMWLVNSPHC